MSSLATSRGIEAPLAVKLAGDLVRRRSLARPIGIDRRIGKFIRLAPVHRQLFRLPLPPSHTPVRGPDPPDGTPHDNS